MTRYSVPGTPFYELRELSDSEVFSLLQQGATLHFRERSNGVESSVGYKNGKWIYTFDDKTQRFDNVLELIFRMNGLHVASTTEDGKDIDVTLTRG